MGLRQAVTIIGAVVGYAFGNPQIGFAIGSILGGWLDPEVIDGPKVGDIATQTSAEGVPCPLFAGTAGAAGNLIYKGPVDKSYVNEGGKGAPPEQRIERLHCTFAIRVGASLFTGPGNRTSRLELVKIWEMEKLVYDVSPDSTILEESAAYAEANDLVFYPGDEEQLPDPAIEAIKGVGNVPSYRGRAYVRMRKDVTDYRGAVPEFRFEVAVGATVTPFTGAVTSKDFYDGVPASLEFGQLDVWEGESTLLMSIGSSPGGDYITAGLTASPYIMVRKRGEDGLYTTLTPPTLTGAASQTAWHPTGQYLAVRVFSANLVRVYRLEADDTFTEVAALSVAGPISVAWSPDGQRFAVCRNNGNSTVNLYWFIDGAFGAPTSADCETVTSGAASLEFSPDSLFLVAGGSQGLDAFRTASATITHFGNHPTDKPCNRGIGFSSNGGYLYTLGGTITPLAVYTFNEAAIATGDVFDFDNYPVDQPDSSPWRLDVTQSGEYVIVADGSPDLKVYEANGTGDQLTLVADQPPAADENILDAQWTDTPEIAGTVDAATVALSDVILATGARCKMAASLFDVDHLADDIVRGTVVASQNYTAQDFLNALRWVYLLDGADYDGTIHFPRRGGDSAFTLTDDDLVDEQDDGEQNETLRNGDDKRKGAIRRPLKLHLMFPNRTVGYQLTKATSPFYPDRGDAVSETTLEVPVVLEDTTEAPQLADKLEKISQADAEAEIVRIVHEGAGAKLTCGSVGTFTERGLTRRVRLETYRDGSGTKRLLMRVDRPHAYRSQMTKQAVPAPPAPPPSLAGPTQFVVLNIPGIIDADDLLGIRIGVAGLSGSAWSGAFVRLSSDGGTTWTSLATITARARMGVLLDALAGASPYYPDRTNEIRVGMLDDRELETLTEAQWLSEGNGAAIMRDDGTAELLQFRDAVDEGDDEWTLSHLQRGRLATDSSGHDAGAKFVMLDGTVFVPLPSSLIGQELMLQFISIGTTADTAPTFTFTWDPAASQTEFPPANLTLSNEGAVLTATVTPRFRFGTEDSPVDSANHTGYRWTATDGVNTTTVDTVGPQYLFGVALWSSPITVTVAALNRYTGAGPSLSEDIA